MNNNFNLNSCNEILDKLYTGFDRNLFELFCEDLELDKEFSVEEISKAFKMFVKVKF